METKIKLEKTSLSKHQREALKLCKAFLKENFEVYFVGGSVRDFLLQRASSDIDLNTNAKPGEIKRILENQGVRFFSLGEKFGTISALLKGGKVEITTFRRESGYEDFRHPSNVEFVSDLFEDLKRRDFTINALALDPVSFEVFDYFGGVTDIKNKRVKFVGNAEVRIKEDPLRMLRAMRFATVLKFKIQAEDLTVIRKHAKLIKKISGERVKEELDKIFSSDNYMRGFELLDETFLLKFIFPEVDNLKKVEQSKDVHAEGNAFIHTKKVLEFLKDESMVMRYAALFHDIGKYGTASKRVVNGRRRISFFGHARLGTKRFNQISKRIPFKKEEKKELAYPIDHHMDILHLEQIKRKTLIKWALKPYFKELILLRLADTKGSHLTSVKGHVLRRDLKDCKNLLKLADKVKEVKSNPVVSGNDVMKVLNINSGKKVGEVLSKIQMLQLEDKIKNKNDALKLLKTLDKRKPLL